jgi:hypothetical protein
MESELVAASYALVGRIDIEIHIVYLVLGGFVVLLAFHIPTPAIHPGRGRVKP